MTNRPRDPDEIIEKLRYFIIHWPLYSPFRLWPESPGPTHAFQFPEAISKPCDSCTKELTTTWHLVKEPVPQARHVHVNPGDFIKYQCAYCNRRRISIWLQRRYKEVRGDESPKRYEYGVYQKLGQWPAPSINPPREIDRRLEAGHVALWKNGLVCLSQGYGLGALAYFRRVIEETTDRLLTILEEGAQHRDDEEQLEKIAQAREKTTAEDRLRLAADALPDLLRPGGVNPLRTLYQEFSRAIHGRSDDECLAIAEKLRVVFEYTFKKIPEAVEDAKRFREALED